MNFQVVILNRIASAWIRWRIRRLYNSSKWIDAYNFAMPHINCKTNNLFAQDIVIRSLWNLRKWDEVIDFSKKYPSDENLVMAKRAMLKISFTEKSLPTPLLHIEWNEDNLLENWYQENNTIWMRHPWGWTYWIMPFNFKLADTHPSLLALATNVLLKPWVPETTKIVTKKRGFGDRLALSFSGGVDSAAAALLLPDDTILAYHERDFTSLLSHDLPIRLFNKIELRWERNVLQIPSNHEKIRAFHGNIVGFSTDYAAGVHLILLADYLNLNAIAFGTPIDNTWLKKGRKFRDFKETWHWKYWKKAFADAGLHLVMPINHISEAGALRICQQSNISDVINSCLRGDGEDYCGKCWKCFHKNGPIGRGINPNAEEIQILLHKMPLRTAQHALWAIQKMGLEFMVPHLSEELIEPLDWWEKAYQPGLDLINGPWKSTIQKRTEEWIDYMDNHDLLHQVDLFPEYPF